MAAVKKGRKSRPSHRRRDQIDYERMSYEELEALMQPRQIAFAEELDKGGSDAECYIRAGYSPKGATANASKLKNDGKFIAFRRRRAQKLYAAQGITKEWIGLKRLKLLEKAEAEGNDRLAVEILKQMMSDMGAGESQVRVEIVAPADAVKEAEEWSK